MKLSYTFGQEKPPEWLEDCLCFAFSNDGTELGCLVWLDKTHILPLERGDILELHEGGKIIVRKCPKSQAIVCEVTTERSD